MRIIFSLLIFATLITALSPPAIATDERVALLAPFSNTSNLIGKIPDGYFEPVALNSRSLFAAHAGSRYELVLPRLGMLAVVHDGTRRINMGGTVTRWEGHINEHDSLKVAFVRGISGMVTGVIDTPAGRVLLGQAGDYVLYKQSSSLPLSARHTNPDIPEALLGEALNIQRPSSASYPIEFNAAALASVPINGEVNISLPGAGDFRVVHDYTLAGDLGATTFVGYLKNFGDDFRMIVTYSPSGAQGQISTPFGMYLIKTLNRQQWLIDVKGSGMQRIVPTSNDAIDHTDAARASSTAGESIQGVAAGDTGMAVAPAPSPPAAGAAAADGLTGIDVLVLYTPGMETRYGGSNQVQTRIQNLVALANQAYIDSGVNIQLRLVGAVPINAPDYSANSDTLDAVTNGTGPYANVATLRNAYGADLVSVIRPFSMAQGGLCGTAWVGGSDGASISLFRDQAFSVVGDGQDGDYYCSGYTLAHELGHNMGNVHDRATVAQQNSGQGAFPYSFGYGIAGQFGTIMSYIDPEIGKFSNPDKTCTGQSPCGIAATDVNSADNALSLNNTRSYVAAFAPEADAATQLVTVAGVITSRGLALSGVKMNASSPAQCSSTGENGSFSCIIARNWNGTITPTLANYTFNPAALTLSNLNSNTANQNFTAVENKNLGSMPQTSPSPSSGGGTLDVATLTLAVVSAAFRSRRDRRSLPWRSCTCHGTCV